MQVILKQDVKGSGKAGDLVKVSDGYARNFLFPKGLAVPASAAAVNEKATKDAALAHHKQEELEAAQALAAQLDGKSVELKARAGANGKIFGSVTSKEIAQELKQRHGLELEKKKIVLESEIKAFGTYSFEAKLHPGVVAKMTVKVTEE
ncbi:MAG: 50S ribosomal protein L9 [Oscillospiraceae bacterium]|jgi:large subunit ribosomal protein L9|nr:50S ribosomal protein L9 [Oscillospiraceae bacterium]